MRNPIESTVSNLIRTDFSTFVAYAFKERHGKSIGDQRYVALMCYVVSGFISRRTRRLLINLPPQHLKSFVCTLCLAAFLLGVNPRLRIMVVAYSDAYASRLAGGIRDLLNARWYKNAFGTRIKAGHDRIDDFETTVGGGIYAAGAQGAITGFTADVIIYDDPHELKDWNNEKALAAVNDNFNLLLTRMQDKVEGLIIVVAHRVSETDLSGKLLESKDWHSLRLPFMAPKQRAYEIEDDTWIRERGELLRPAAYPKAEVNRLKTEQVSPPYGLLYQQGLDPQAFQPIRPNQFQSHGKHDIPLTPVVISIDPGQSGGINASRSAIQAWKAGGNRHFLLDQVCDHYDFEQLRKTVRKFIARHNPSVVLIEKTANGPALYTDLKKMNPRFEIKLIVPQGQKAERLARHSPKIRKRRISLPLDAIWREPFIDEIVGFPGAFDDQVDALTQYLDYMDTKPIIRKMPPRELAIGIALGSQRVWRRW